MENEWSIKLKNARESIGLTQKKLALIIGVTERAIQQFEYGSNYPSYYTLQRLCDTLSIDFNVMLHNIIVVCDHPEILDKEYSEVARIINSSDELELLDGDIYNEGSKYNRNFCTLIFTKDGGSKPPDGDIVIGKMLLLEKSYEIKQRLKEEYERQILKYAKSLISKKKKKPD